MSKLNNNADFANVGEIILQVTDLQRLATPL